VRWRWTKPASAARRRSEEELYFQRLMPVDALRIRGRHNAANALAALALATSTGAPLAPMLHGLREYRGEPHRVEPVASSTAWSTSTTARAPTWVPRWPPCVAWVPTGRWW
jgi:UDP-N-acetylmuramoylalanine-D-glutamate ligase